MTEVLSADSIGPVDIAVVVFQGNQFNGEIAPALAALHEDGTVRILDLTFVSKDLQGQTTFVEVEDADVAAQYEHVKGQTFELLSEEDLDQIAGDLDPNSSALVVVWENTWAAPLSAAIRESNGQLAALVRIPRENVLRAFEATRDEE